MSLTDLSLAIGMPYGAIGTFVSPHGYLVIIIFIFFSSKRPRATQEPVMPLIFVPNRSASVRGVHRHQVIVILACHVSSENLFRLHGTTTTTMHDTNHTFFEPISTTVFSKGLPPVIVAKYSQKLVKQV